MSETIEWHKSSFSEGEGANCVEVARHEGTILIRESDSPETVIATSSDKLRVFMTGIKAGEFDGFAD